MSAEQAIDYIRDSVRKVFSPRCTIEFSDGQSRVRGAITRVRVEAWVGSERLTYDRSQLLRLLEVDSVERDGDEYALLAGMVKGVHYELRLFAEPQVVSAQ